MVTDPNRILIFDTTLRDGVQSPGCSMTQPVPEKRDLCVSCPRCGL
jgi:isopropylmalate/homocitrate/citramalate synthase